MASRPSRNLRFYDPKSFDHGLANRHLSSAPQQPTQRATRDAISFFRSHTKVKREEKNANTNCDSCRFSASASSATWLPSSAFARIHTQSATFTKTSKQQFGIFTYIIQKLVQYFHVNSRTYVCFLLCAALPAARSVCTEEEYIE